MSLHLQTMVRPSKILCISMILLVQWMLIMKPTPARSAVIHDEHEKVSITLATTKYFLGNGKDKIKPKLNGQSNSVDLVDKVKLLMQFSTDIGTDSTLMAAGSAFGTIFEIAAVDKLWKIGRELPKIGEPDHQNQNSIEYAKSLVDYSMQCQKTYLDSWINESCSKLNVSDLQQNFCDNYHSSDGIQLNLTCSNAPTAIKCSRSEDGSLAWSAIPQCHQPGDWSSWSDCSQTCGIGTITRQRSWPHKPEKIEHETCNIYCCSDNTTAQQYAVGQNLVTDRYHPGEVLICTENGFVKDGCLHNATGQQYAVGQSLVADEYQVLICKENGFVNDGCSHNATGRQVAVGQSLVTDKYCPGDHVLNCTENGFVDAVLARPSSCPWPTTSYGCIKVFDSKYLSWCDARKACREIGAALVAPDTEADYAALAAYMTQEYSGWNYWFWTSATNRLGYWEYAGNNRLLGDGVSQDWGTGQPAHIGAGKTECGFMWGRSTYKLADFYCDGTNSFICEIKV